MAELLARLQAFEAQLVSSPANCDVEEVQELVATHLVPWLNTALTPEYIIEANNDPSEWWRTAADAISPETARMPLVDRIAAVRVLLPMTIALPTDDDDAALPAYYALRAVALEALTRALRLCVAMGAMDFAVALVQLARVDYSDRREKAFESIRKNAEKKAAKKEKKEKSDKKDKKVKRAGASEEQSEGDSSAAQSSSGIFSVTDVSEVTPQMVVDYTRKNYKIMRSPAYVTLLLWFSSVTRIDDFDIAAFVNLDRGAVPAVAISYAASDAERQWSHALCVFFTTPGFLTADAPALPPSIALATAANPVISGDPRADATFTAKTHAIGTDRYHDKFCERLFTRVCNDAREANIALPGPHYDDKSHRMLSMGLLLAHALAADVNAFAEREFALNPPTNNASAAGDYKTAVGLIASAPAFGLWIQHCLAALFPSSLVVFGVISELLTVILSLLLDSPKNGAEFTSLSERQRRALQLLRRCLDPVIARLPTIQLPPAEAITARLHTTAGARGAFTPLLLPLLKQPSDADALAALTRGPGDPAASARVSTLDLDDTAFVLWLDIAPPEPGDMSLTARLQIARRENVLEWLSPQRGQVWMPYVRINTAPKQLLPFGDEPLTAFALMPATPLPRENDAEENPSLALPVLSPTRVSPRVLVDYLLSLIDNPTGDADLDAVAAAVPALILQQASVRGAMHDKMARDAGRWRDDAANPEFLPSLCHAALQERLRSEPVTPDRLLQLAHSDDDSAPPDTSFIASIVNSNDNTMDYWLELLLKCVAALPAAARKKRLAGLATVLANVIIGRSGEGSLAALAPAMYSSVTTLANAAPNAHNAPLLYTVDLLLALVPTAAQTSSFLAVALCKIYATLFIEINSLAQMRKVTSIGHIDFMRISDAAFDALFTLCPEQPVAVIEDTDKGSSSLSGNNSGSSSAKTTGPISAGVAVASGTSLTTLQRAVVEIFLLDDEAEKLTRERGANKISLSLPEEAHAVCRRWAEHDHARRLNTLLGKVTFGAEANKFGTASAAMSVSRVLHAMARTADVSLVLASWRDSLMPTLVAPAAPFAESTVATSVEIANVLLAFANETAASVNNVCKTEKTWRWPCLLLNNTATDRVRSLVELTNYYHNRDAKQYQALLTGLKAFLAESVAPFLAGLVAASKVSVSANADYAHARCSAQLHGALLRLLRYALPQVATSADVSELISAVAEHDSGMIDLSDSEAAATDEEDTDGDDDRQEEEQKEEEKRGVREPKIIGEDTSSRNLPVFPVKPSISRSRNSRQKALNGFVETIRSLSTGASGRAMGGVGNALGQALDAYASSTKTRDTKAGRMHHTDRFLEDESSSDSSDGDARGNGKDRNNDSSDSDDAEQSNGGVFMTPTARSNLAQLQLMMQSRVHIIVEGETGQGKSALVTESSRQLGLDLVRVNLSATTSRDTLFGHATLHDGGRFCMTEGPFLRAYRTGAVLLLDELNLAQDAVLQSIEAALDPTVTVYTLPREADVFLGNVKGDDGKDKPQYEWRTRVERHPDFRLVCTQNPAGSRYSRQSHSDAFLSHFSIVKFKSYNADDMRLIAQRRIAARWPRRGEGLQSWAKRLTKAFLGAAATELHRAMIAAFGYPAVATAKGSDALPSVVDSTPVLKAAQKLATDQPAIESVALEGKEAYAEITLRDLLQLCDGLTALLTTATPARLGLSGGSSADAADTAAAVAFKLEAWACYAARLRSNTSRNDLAAVVAALTNTLFPNSAANSGNSAQNMFDNLRVSAVGGARSSIVSAGVTAGPYTANTPIGFLTAVEAILSKKKMTREQRASFPLVRGACMALWNELRRQAESWGVVPVDLVGLARAMLDAAKVDSGVGVATNKSSKRGGATQANGWFGDLEPDVFGAAEESDNDSHQLYNGQPTSANPINLALTDTTRAAPAASLMDDDLIVSSRATGRTHRYNARNSSSSAAGGDDDDDNEEEDMASVTDAIRNRIAIAFYKTVFPWFATPCHNDLLNVLRSALGDSAVSAVRGLDASNDAARLVQPVRLNLVPGAFVCLVRAASLRQPVLMSGPAASGKTSLLRALTFLTSGLAPEEVFLTRQSEPEDLIGHHSIAQGKRLIWVDGAVTRAAEAGLPCVLHSADLAPATVLERLNPVMEDPPHLSVHENNEAVPRKLGKGFFVAAMVTTTAEAVAVHGSGISPAFFNRCSVIHVDPAARADGSTRFLSAIAAPYLAGRTELHALAPLLAQWVATAGIVDTPISMRAAYHIVRAAVAAAPAIARFPYSAAPGSVAVNSDLVWRAHMWLSGTLFVRATPALRRAWFAGEHRNAVRAACVHCLACYPTALWGADWGQPTATYTPCGTALNLAALACLARSPLLLEGDAATGKTALARHLARIHAPLDDYDFGVTEEKIPSETSMKGVLERFNNSKSTRREDYFGSFVPAGAGEFIWVSGPLTRALSAGGVFLADEFNLCPSDVMNCLAPVLESGLCAVTTYDNETHAPIVKRARSSFLFLATQNPAAMRGRSAIPPALLERFALIPVRPYIKGQLEHIAKNFVEKHSVANTLVATADASRLFGITRVAAPAQSQIKASDAASVLVTVMQILSDAAANGDLTVRGSAGVEGAEGAFTVRFMQRWYGRFTKAFTHNAFFIETPALTNLTVALGGSSGRAMALLLLVGFELASSIIVATDREKVAGAFMNALVVTNLVDGHNANAAAAALMAACPVAVTVREARDHALLMRGSRAVLVPPHAVALMVSSNVALSTAPQTLLQPLVLAASALTAAEPTCLIGPSGVKTIVAEAALAVASDRNANDALERVYLTSLSETHDLVGHIHACAIDAAPLAFVTAMQSLVARLRALQKDLVSVAERDIASKLLQPIEAVYTEVDEKFQQFEVSVDEEDKPSVDGACKATTAVPASKPVSVASPSPAFVPKSHVREPKLKGRKAVDDESESEKSFASSTEDESDSQSSSPDDSDSFVNVADNVEDYDSNDASPHMSLAMPSSVGINKRQRIQSFFTSTEVASAYSRLHFIATTVETSLVKDTSELALVRDPAVLNLIKWICAFVTRLSTCNKPGAPGMDFVFNDGPLTIALKQGRTLLLEGLDEPSAAVTERFNSALEYERNFNLTEDVFSQRQAGGIIAIPSSFRLAATVTFDPNAGMLRLSSALRSRLTEVWTEGYEAAELCTAVSTVMRTEESKFAPEALTALDNVMRSVVTWAVPAHAARGTVFGIRNSLRLAHFVTAYAKTHANVFGRERRMTPEHACAIAASAVQFVVLNAIPREDRETLRDALSAAVLSKSFGNVTVKRLLADTKFDTAEAAAAALKATADGYRGALPPSFAADDKHFDHPPMWGVSAETRRLVAIAEDDTTLLAGVAVVDTIALAPCRRGWRACDVWAVWRHERFCALKSVRKNLENIFFATSLGMPLLLEGAPGNGKTAIVRLVHRVLGFAGVKTAARIDNEVVAVIDPAARKSDFDHYVRLNATRSSTSGAMFGQYIASADSEGQQVFLWQEGAMSSALQEARDCTDGSQLTFLLLDEINTYSSEILQTIVPYIADSVPGAAVTHGDPAKRLVPASVRVFATMNPASVGGGRVTLPPALSNLFVRVELEEYTNDDLCLIVSHLTLGNEKNILGKAEVELLLRIHIKLSTMITNRDIASIPRHENYNLRDLTMLLAMVRTYTPIMQALSRLSSSSGPAVNAASSSSSSSSFSAVNTDVARDSSVARHAVSKFASLVYAHRISDSKEQALAVKAIVDETNSASDSAAAAAQQRSGAAHDYLDSDVSFTSLANAETVAVMSRFIRIGIVFAQRGPHRSMELPLVHTADTVELLEAMLAASQSRCPVLLEGPLCGGKTALVRELARLCGHKLNTVNLHQDADDGDLVGTWVPRSSDRTSKNTLEHAISASDAVFIAVCANLRKRVRATMTLKNAALLVALAKEHRAISEATAIDTAIAAVQAFRTAYNHLPNALVCSDHRALLKKHSDALNEEINATRAAKRAAEIAASSDGPTSHAVKFEFEYSKLVNALETGEWVLLDAVTACPPHVIERILSVLEGESASMTLLEDGTGRMWTAAPVPGGNTKLRSQINPNFRLFLTSTTGRAGTHKLSSALRNRVVKITVPALHERKGYAEILNRVATQFTASVADSSLAGATKHALPMHLVANTVVTVFRNVRQLVASSRITAPLGLSLSHRSALSAAAMATRMASGPNAVPMTVALARVLSMIIVDRFNDESERDEVTDKIVTALIPFANATGVNMPAPVIEKASTAEFVESSTGAHAAIVMHQAMRRRGRQLLRSVKKLEQDIKPVVSWLLSVAPALQRAPGLAVWLGDVTPLTVQEVEIQVVAGRELKKAALHVVTEAVGAVSVLAIPSLRDLLASFADAAAALKKLRPLRKALQLISHSGLEAVVSESGGNDARCARTLLSELEAAVAVCDWIKEVRQKLDALAEHRTCAGIIGEAEDASEQLKETSVDGLAYALLDEVMSLSLFTSPGFSKASAGVPVLTLGEKRRTLVAALLDASDKINGLNVSAPDQINLEVLLTTLAATALKWRVMAKTGVGSLQRVVLRHDELLQYFDAAVLHKVKIALTDFLVITSSVYKKAPNLMDNDLFFERIGPGTLLWQKCEQVVFSGVCNRLNAAALLACVPEHRSTVDAATNRVQSCALSTARLDTDEWMSHPLGLMMLTVHHALFYPHSPRHDIVAVRYHSLAAMDDPALDRYAALRADEAASDSVEVHIAWVPVHATAQFAHADVQRDFGVLVTFPTFPAPAAGLPMTDSDHEQRDENKSDEMEAGTAQCNRVGRAAVLIVPASTLRHKETKNRLDNDWCLRFPGLRVITVDVKVSYDHIAPVARSVLPNQQHEEEEEEGVPIYGHASAPMVDEDVEEELAKPISVVSALCLTVKNVLVGHLAHPAALIKLGATQSIDVEQHRGEPELLFERDSQQLLSELRSYTNNVSVDVTQSVPAELTRAREAMRVSQIFDVLVDQFQQSNGERPDQAVTYFRENGLIPIKSADDAFIIELSLVANLTWESISRVPAHEHAQAMFQLRDCINNSIVFKLPQDMNIDDHPLTDVISAFEDRSEQQSRFAPALDSARKLLGCTLDGVAAAEALIKGVANVLLIDSQHVATRQTSRGYVFRRLMQLVVLWEVMCTAMTALGDAVATFDGMVSQCSGAADILRALAAVYLASVHTNAAADAIPKYALELGDSKSELMVALNGAVKTIGALANNFWRAAENLDPNIKGNAENNQVSDTAVAEVAKQRDRANEQEQRAQADQKAREEEMLRRRRARFSDVRERLHKLLHRVSRTGDAQLLQRGLALLSGLDKLLKQAHEEPVTGAMLVELDTQVKELGIYEADLATVERNGNANSVALQHLLDDPDIKAAAALNEDSCRQLSPDDDRSRVIAIEKLINIWQRYNLASYCQKATVAVHQIDKFVKNLHVICDRGTAMLDVTVLRVFEGDFTRFLAPSIRLANQSYAEWVSKLTTHIVSLVHSVETHDGKKCDHVLHILGIMAYLRTLLQGACRGTSDTSTCRLTVAVDRIAATECAARDGFEVPLWAAYAIKQPAEMTLSSWPGVTTTTAAFMGPEQLSRVLPDLTWAFSAVIAPFADLVSAFPQLSAVTATAGSSDSALSRRAREIVAQIASELTDKTTLLPATVLPALADAVTLFNDAKGSVFHNSTSITPRDIGVARFLALVVLVRAHVTHPEVVALAPPTVVPEQLDAKLLQLQEERRAERDRTVGMVFCNAIKTQNAREIALASKRNDNESELRRLKERIKQVFVSDVDRREHLSKQENDLIAKHKRETDDLVRKWDVSNSTLAAARSQLEAFDKDTAILIGEARQDAIPYKATLFSALACLLTPTGLDPTMLTDMLTNSALPQVLSCVFDDFPLSASELHERMVRADQLLCDLYQSRTDLSLQAPFTKMLGCLIMTSCGEIKGVFDAAEADEKAGAALSTAEKTPGSVRAAAADALSQSRWLHDFTNKFFDTHCAADGLETHTQSRHIRTDITGAASLCLTLKSALQNTKDAVQHAPRVIFTATGRSVTNQDEQDTNVSMSLKHSVRVRHLMIALVSATSTYLRSTYEPGCLHGVISNEDELAAAEIPALTTTTAEANNKDTMVDEDGSTPAPASGASTAPTAVDEVGRDNRRKCERMAAATRIATVTRELQALLGTHAEACTGVTAVPLLLADDLRAMTSAVDTPVIRAANALGRLRLELYQLATQINNDTASQHFVGRTFYEVQQILAGDMRTMAPLVCAASEAFDALKNLATQQNIAFSSVGVLDKLMHELPRCDSADFSAPGSAPGLITHVATAVREARVAFFELLCVRASVLFASAAAFSRDQYSSSFGENDIVDPAKAALVDTILDATARGAAAIAGVCAAACDASQNSLGSDVELAPVVTALVGLLTRALRQIRDLDVSLARDAAIVHNVANSDDNSEGQDDEDEENLGENDDETSDLQIDSALSSDNDALALILSPSAAVVWCLRNGVSRELITCTGDLIDSVAAAWTKLAELIDAQQLQRLADTAATALADRSPALQSDEAWDHLSRERIRQYKHAMRAHVEYLDECVDIRDGNARAFDELMDIMQRATTHHPMNWMIHNVLRQHIPWGRHNELVSRRDSAYSMQHIFNVRVNAVYFPASMAKIDFFKGLVFTPHIILTFIDKQLRSGSRIVVPIHPELLNGGMCKLADTDVGFYMGAPMSGNFLLMATFKEHPDVVFSGDVDLVKFREGFSILHAELQPNNAAKRKNIGTVVVHLKGEGEFTERWVARNASLRDAIHGLSSASGAENVASSVLNDLIRAAGKLRNTPQPVQEPTAPTARGSRKTIIDTIRNTIRHVLCSTMPPVSNALHAVGEMSSAFALFKESTTVTLSSSAAIAEHTSGVTVHLTQVADAADEIVRSWVGNTNLHLLADLVHSTAAHSISGDLMLAGIETRTLQAVLVQVLQTFVSHVHECNHTANVRWGKAQKELAHAITVVIIIALLHCTDFRDAQVAIDALQSYCKKQAINRGGGHLWSPQVPASLVGVFHTTQTLLTYWGRAADNVGKVKTGGVRPHDAMTALRLPRNMRDTPVNQANLRSHTGALELLRRLNFSGSSVMELTENSPGDDNGDNDENKDTGQDASAAEIPRFKWSQPGVIANFGVMCPGEAMAHREVRIRNATAHNVEYTVELCVAGSRDAIPAGADGFAQRAGLWVSPMHGTLLAAQTATLRVSVEPLLSQPISMLWDVYVRMRAVRSSGIDLPETAFRVTRLLDMPRLRLSAPRVLFAPLKLASGGGQFSPATASLTITNPGESDVTYALSLGEQWRVTAAQSVSDPLGTSSIDRDWRSAVSGPGYTVASSSSASASVSSRSSSRLSAPAIATLPIRADCFRLSVEDALSAASSAATEARVLVGPGQNREVRIECAPLPLGNFALATVLQLRPIGASDAPAQTLRVPVIATATVPQAIVRVSQSQPLSGSRVDVTARMQTGLQWTDIPGVPFVETPKRDFADHRAPRSQSVQHKITFGTPMSRGGLLRTACLIAVASGERGGEQPYKVETVESPAGVTVLFNNKKTLKDKAGGIAASASVAIINVSVSIEAYLAVTLKSSFTVKFNIITDTSQRIVELVIPLDNDFISSYINSLSISCSNVDRVLTRTRENENMSLILTDTQNFRSCKDRPTAVAVPIPGQDGIRLLSV